ALGCEPELVDPGNGVVAVGLEVSRIGWVVYAEGVDFRQVDVQPSRPHGSEHGSVSEDVLAVSYERPDVEVLEPSEVLGRDDDLVCVPDACGAGDDWVHRCACAGDDVDAVVEGERADAARRIRGEWRLRRERARIAEVASNRMLPEERLDRI